MASLTEIRPSRLRWLWHSALYTLCAALFANATDLGGAEYGLAVLGWGVALGYLFRFPPPTAQLVEDGEEFALLVEGQRQVASAKPALCSPWAVGVWVQTQGQQNASVRLHWLWRDSLSEEQFRHLSQWLRWRN